MNRKGFLSAFSAVLSLGGLPGIANKAASPPADPAVPFARIPSYLRPGDEIGICCPAGSMSLEEVQPAAIEIGRWGFRTRMGATVGKKDFTFGGSDEERISDFQQMLDDPHLKAILCARGGYGSVRIIDKLDFRQFRKKPKWIIGFSDITVIHAHLWHNYHTASIHSKMCNSFPEDWSRAEPVQVDTILSIRKALGGERMHYELPPNENNRTGTARGILVGGNLKTIEALAGTRSDLLTDGYILFVEDTGEYLYSIDRMFWNLKRTGKLRHLKGLIIGGFKIKPDDPGEEFGLTLHEIVREKVKEYGYPVCFDFPVGHQKENYALKCGVSHKLEVGTGLVTLTEL